MILVIRFFAMLPGRALPLRILFHYSRQESGRVHLHVHRWLKLIVLLLDSIVTFQELQGSDLLVHLQVFLLQSVSALVHQALTCFGRLLVRVVELGP